MNDPTHKWIVQASGIQKLNLRKAEYGSSRLKICRRLDGKQLKRPLGDRFFKVTNSAGFACETLNAIGCDRDC